MAQHHGAGYPAHPRYPQPMFPHSMDAMANAPFEDMINHINSVNHHMFHVHHHVHHINAMPLSLPPPSLPVCPNMHNFHNAMMNHNMHVQQAMQDMARMQNAMAVAMNQNVMAMHVMHVNNTILPGHHQHHHQQHPHNTMHHRHHHGHGHGHGHHHGHGSDYESMLRLDENVRKKGVSDSDLAKLKRVKFSARENCKQCGICQENFTVGTKVIALPCKHVYCEDEILTWFDQHKTCPTCRHVVEDIPVY